MLMFTWLFNNQFFRHAYFKCLIENCKIKYQHCQQATFQYQTVKHDRTENEKYGAEKE